MEGPIVKLILILIGIALALMVGVLAWRFLSTNDDFDGRPIEPLMAQYIRQGDIDDEESCKARGGVPGDDNDTDKVADDACQASSGNYLCLAGSKKAEVFDITSGECPGS